MTYLQFLLVIHVLGAIVGFGSTYAFAFFPQEGERLEPRVRGTFADVSYKITTRFSVPVAFFTQPIGTGTSSRTRGSGSRSPCTWW
jgi:hypothetical protein